MRIILGLVLVLSFVGCSGEGEVVQETPAPLNPGEAWLADGGVLRRGGNGRIDSEVLSVTSMKLGSEAEPSLVVWVRYRHLDSSWTWDLEKHPVFARVEVHEGEALTRREDLENLDSLAQFGTIPAPEKPVAGDFFVTSYVFDAPAEDANLVVRTFTKRDGKDFELVAVLVPPTNRRAPPTGRR